MTPLEKKQMRKVRSKVRRLDIRIEGAIRSSASSPVQVAHRPLDIDHLYQRAVKDIGLRVRLTDAWHAGDVQAGKRRRKLNDWELATDPAGPADAWQPDDHARPAVGKCDVDAVKSLNKAKRGY